MVDDPTQHCLRLRDGVGVLDGSQEQVDHDEVRSSRPGFEVAACGLNLQAERAQLGNQRLDVGEIGRHVGVVPCEDRSYEFRA